MNRTLYEGIYAVKPPRYLRELMLSRGGRNPFNEPNYRLVRAEGRTRRVWGSWTEWTPGTPVAERNPLVGRAIRTLTEWRQVPLYPGIHGWVLERWFPPEMYGTKHRWFQIEELGGTVKMIDGVEMPAYGGYPSMGDYETTNYIMPEIALTEKMVGGLVGMFQQALQEVSDNERERTRQSMDDQHAEEAQRQAEFDAFAEQELGEAMQESPSLDSWSLGGQAEMHRIAEKIGIKSQLF